MSRREQIETNLTAVRDRIARACADAGRDPGDVTLIVITKFHPVSDIGHLVDLGVTDIGENRDQEAGAKIAELDASTRAALTVHFVGQLQTNKAKHVVQYADCVQSVDRAKLVGALDRAVGARVIDPAGEPGGQGQQNHYENAGSTSETTTKIWGLDVLLQVDLGEGEDAGRGGILPADLTALADRVADAEHLRLRGLMAVAPFGLDEAGTRAAFARLEDLAAGVREAHPEATILSAGMSGDLELAVAAGATHLRVGTAILGERPDPR
ncbi:YggS family pyridoxal phosphate enzyme [Ornithinimicrobium sp. F0845]|uniref:YggS family pyridoxal phosphate enzyme n=1 Tax=Ornithinimicrobium sp. F0845 TaxID=2926412 RepID=UPI001FF67EFE|nr:YggS family pyridoxal phosphate enzyme [Ornithinimicrobium sp. F0845]MCK0112693.1 YggS family pyridoxal phosphate enzyme [Ornithinimicrobium sp. F0845]